MADRNKDHLAEQLKQIEESLLRVISIVKLLEDDWEEEHRGRIWHQISRQIELSEEVYRRIQVLKEKVVPVLRIPLIQPTQSTWEEILRTTQNIHEGQSWVNASLVDHLISLLNRMKLEENLETTKAGELKQNIRKAREYLSTSPRKEERIVQLAQNTLELMDKDMTIQEIRQTR
jgi:hypothetical protein